MKNTVSFESFFIHSPSPCLLTDKQARILLVNAACVETFAQKEAVAAGRHVWELIHPNEVEVAQTTIQENAFGSGYPIEMTFGAHPETKGPSLKWRVFSDSNPDSGNLCWIAVEEGVFSENSRFIAMESLSEIAAGVAHEINNPTTIIHGTAALLKRAIDSDENDGEKVRRGLDRIEKSAFRISRILRELRYFSGDGSHIPKTRMKLIEIINDVSTHFLEKSSETGIAFELEPVPDLTIRCRPNQIAQILLNLLNNACDAVERIEAKKITLSFSTVKPGFVAISVTDNGLGIDVSDRKRVMDPFFTTKPPGKGTGLGLPISKRIAEDHRGSLYLDPSCSNTRFTLELPL